MSAVQMACLVLQFWFCPTVQCVCDRYEEKKKKQEAELERLGLAPKDAHRLETLERVSFPRAATHPDFRLILPAMTVQHASNHPRPRLCTRRSRRKRLHSAGMPSTRRHFTMRMKNEPHRSSTGFLRRLSHVFHSVLLICSC